MDVFAPSSKSSQGNRNWGDYYLQSRNKKSWALDFVHSVNQAVPTFNELFDEETFYIFAIIVVIGAILTAVFLSKIVGITIKERPLEFHREMRDPLPAHFLRFPWQRPKRE